LFGTKGYVVVVVVVVVVYLCLMNCFKFGARIEKEWNILFISCWFMGN
jgi:hypothetical protein